MAIRMVKTITLLILLTNASAFADTSEIWRQKLEASLESNKRVTFGQVEITKGEKNALEEAKTIARAEMAKTFKLKIKTDSTQESTYKQTNNLADFKKIYSTTSTQEITEEFNLVGLDLSKYTIDNDKKTIIVAAILNLTEYEKYLTKERDDKLSSLDTITANKVCITLSDLKNLRLRNKIITEAIKSEELLSTFSSKTSNVIKKQNEELNKIKKCKEKFPISTYGVQSDIRMDINKMMQDEGYIINNNKNEKNQITIKKEISPPETKFDQVNLLGKIEITLSLENIAPINLKTPTIRQVAPDSESAKMKLEIRLNDLMQKSVKNLLEDNL